MPPATKGTRDTAFRPTGAYTGSGAQATAVRHTPQLPQREPPPALVKSPKPRQQVQMAWIGLILVTSLIGGALGLAYLSACASVTREGHRKASLKSMLRQEREKAQNLRELRGQVMTPAAIERIAKERGMIRADDQQATTIR
jgi:hypothetical protein